MREKTSQSLNYVSASLHANVSSYFRYIFILGKLYIINWLGDATYSKQLFPCNVKNTMSRNCEISLRMKFGSLIILI